MNAYTIRLCTSFEDYDKCLELQRKVWGVPEVDVTPSRIYVISSNAGGFLMGAFTPEARLVAFLHTFPGFNEEREPFYYSHMLAVTPELQNSGLGYLLKLKQRERALEKGVRYVQWTFDPLQSRNAYFNINKLGCVVRSYKVNYYGATNTSVFDAGIEADRLMAEWWVNTARVERVIAGERPPVPAGAPYVEVPVNYNDVRAGGLNEARKWRLEVRARFQEMFARGLTVTAFERGDKMSRYYFTEWQPE